MILVDNANWKGIDFVSHPVGGAFHYGGYVYANEYEVMLAKTLRHLGIANTPNVRIPLLYPDGRTRFYHPDVLFNGFAYFYTSPKTGKREVAHGFEAKSRASGTMEPEKKRLLFAQTGINVPIIDNKTIKRFYEQRYLPLEPFIVSP